MFRKQYGDIVDGFRSRELTELQKLASATADADERVQIKRSANILQQQLAAAKQQDERVRSGACGGAPFFAVYLLIHLLVIYFYFLSLYFIMYFFQG